MEKFITATGKTIDLAIEAALRELKMDRDSVSVEVLENPKSGFLGFGASSPSAGGSSLGSANTGIHCHAHHITKAAAASGSI